jgi:hypothetical protein
VLPPQQQQQQQQQPQHQQASMQPHSRQAGASAAFSAQPGLSSMPWLTQGLAPPWPNQAGMQGAQWQLPPASLAQLAAAFAANVPGQMTLGQQTPYGQMQLPLLGHPMLPAQTMANGVPQPSIAAGGTHGIQPASGPLGDAGSTAAMLHASSHVAGNSVSVAAPIPSGLAPSAALQPSVLAEQMPATLLGMPVPPLQQQALNPSKQQTISAPTNGRTHLAGS